METKCNIRKLYDQAQLAAHCFDIATQGRKHQVTSFLHLCNCCFADVQCRGQMRIGKFLRFVQFLKRQLLRMQTVRSSKDTISPSFRKRIQYSFKEFSITSSIPVWQNAGKAPAKLDVRDTFRRIKLGFHCAEFENSSISSSRTCGLESSPWFQS